MNNSGEKIFVVDADLESLQVIARLVRGAGYLVVACESGKEFLHCLDYQSTLCVVFDMNMPDINGLALQKILTSQKCNLPMIFIAEFTTVSTCVEAMKAGAIDVLEKPFDPERLLGAIQEAARKHRRARETAAAFDQFCSLTEREREVFKLVTTGMLNKQIAASLGVAEKTIKVHRGRVMKKLEVQSVAQLVRLHDQISHTSTFYEKRRAPRRSGNFAVF